MEYIARYDFTACGKHIRCALTSQQVDDCDLVRYTTYGAEFSDYDGNLLFSRTDISTDRQFVEYFIGLCVSGEVADVHLGDVLEDCLP